MVGTCGLAWCPRPHLQGTPTPTCRVHCQAGHPFAVWHQLLGELLAQQVVEADTALRGRQQEGPHGVEGHALHLPMAAAEGTLAAAPAQLVDQHLGVARGGQHHGHVVPTPVPGHLCHWLQKGEGS